MLNEYHAQLLIDNLTEKDISEMFSAFRMQRLQRLNTGSADYEVGKKVQDEIAALFRLETELISFRRDTVVKQSEETESKKNS